MKLLDTDGAGLKAALPAWSALTVHVPAPTRVIVRPLVPLDVQTVGVVVVKDTVSPEDAVASRSPATGASSGSQVAERDRLVGPGGPTPKFQRLAALLRTVIRTSPASAPPTSVSRALTHGSGVAGSSVRDGRAGRDRDIVAEHRQGVGREVGIDAVEQRLVDGEDEGQWRRRARGGRRDPELEGEERVARADRRRAGVVDSVTSTGPPFGARDRDGDRLAGGRGADGPDLDGDVAREVGQGDRKRAADRGRQPTRRSGASPHGSWTSMRYVPSVKPAKFAGRRSSCDRRGRPARRRSRTRSGRRGSRRSRASRCRARARRRSRSRDDEFSRLMPARSSPAKKSRSGGLTRSLAGKSGGARCWAATSGCTRPTTRTSRRSRTSPPPRPRCGGGWPGAGAPRGRRGARRRPDRIDLRLAGNPELADDHGLLVRRR